jgi:ADP-heptose:LPS heptosyltransferase
VTADERLGIQIGPAARCEVSAWIERSGVDVRRPWAVVHPGASASSRRYPPHHFAAATRGLVRELGLQLIFTGDATERPLAEEIRIAADVPTISAVGLFDLEELAALIKMAPLLVSNNTGPVHIAAAVGTPVVDLYALTNPQHTPWMVQHRVLSHDVPCRNCYKSVCPEGHHQCLELVPPAAVVRAAADLLTETEGARAPHRVDLCSPI